MTDIETTKSPVSFGVGQLVNKTPMWARWMFRITFVLITAFSFWVGGTAIIPEQWKLELLLGGKAIEIIVFGVSKLFGVEGEPSDDVRKQIFGE